MRERARLHLHYPTLEGGPNETKGEARHGKVNEEAKIGGVKNNGLIPNPAMSDK